MSRISLLQFIGAQTYSGGPLSKVSEWVVRQKDVPVGASDGKQFHWLKENYPEPDVIGTAFKLFEQSQKFMSANGDVPVSNPDQWRELFHKPEDFMNAPNISFSIEGFLQNDTSTMIGGLSGHMKTFIMLSVVKALLDEKAEKLWDYFPIKEKAKQILYLIPECSLVPFVHRLRLMRLIPYTQNERLLVRTLSMGPPPMLKDPALLSTVKDKEVFLDTALRFAEGDESSASDVSQGLSSDFFALINAGARTLVAAHHSPKTFRNERVMNLENVLRGSGDLGAGPGTCWAVKLIDPITNVVHIENAKPRDFQPCGPFQLIARPFIDIDGDFKMFKRPEECGDLDEEQPAKNAHNEEKKKEHIKRVVTLGCWLKEKDLTDSEIADKFKAEGVTISAPTARRYRQQVLKEMAG